jgi:hypothetical protein
VGRPLKDIDAEQVYKLARLGCTQKEIADFFNCHPDTIRDRFSSELTCARADWKISMRRAQTLRAVKDRSDSMLIHLGKCYLGQNDKNPSEESTDQPPATDTDGNPTEP